MSPKQSSLAKLKTENIAVLPEGRRGIGVIDVGSNSVRLVVYDAEAAYPAPIFNEKILCGLGNLDPETGKLDPAAADHALQTVRRFMVLARYLGLEDVIPFATAAVRDATDGKKFAKQLAQEVGATVRVLSGKEEARYTGLGVLSGIPDAEGIVGDLGGGSLELVPVSGHELGKGISLPIGPLRLGMYDDGTTAGMQKLKDKINNALDKVDCLPASDGKPLYLVGGNWRTLARAHLAQMNTNYPVEVLHHYEIGHDEARGFSAFLSSLSFRTMADIEAISKRRADTLSLAARILNMVLARMPGSSAVTSAYGVREGVLNDVLRFNDSSEPPMLLAARNAEIRRSRHPGFGDAVFKWSKGLFADDDHRLHQVRKLACLTGDMGWRHHPDHRAQIAALELLNVPWPGLTHVERALVCQIVANRYTAKDHGDPVEQTLRLLSADERTWVVRVGLTLRLAYLASGGMPELLRATKISMENGALVLVVKSAEQDLVGEAVEKRLNVLARAFNKKAVIKIAD